jgi:hypothetical protein
MAATPPEEDCVQLDEDLRCRLFGRPERPAVCASLKARPSMCGSSRGQSLQILELLETLTSP